MTQTWRVPEAAASASQPKKEESTRWYWPFIRCCVPLTRLPVTLLFASLTTFLFLQKTTQVRSIACNRRYIHHLNSAYWTPLGFVRDWYRIRFEFISVGSFSLFLFYRCLSLLSLLVFCLSVFLSSLFICHWSMCVRPYFFCVCLSLCPSSLSLALCTVFCCKATHKWKQIEQKCNNWWHLTIILKTYQVRCPFSCGASHEWERWNAQKITQKKKEVISRCQVAGMAKKFDQIQKREKQKTERQETQWQKANF